MENTRRSFLKKVSAAGIGAAAAAGQQGEGHGDGQAQASQFFHLRDYSFLFCLGSFDLCYGAQYKKGM